MGSVSTQAAAKINAFIGEEIVNATSKVVCTYRLVERGMVLHSKEYKRAPKRDNSTVLYQSDGQALKAGIILQLVVVRGVHLAVIQRLQLLDTLPNTMQMSASVAAALQARLLCCRLSSQIQVVAVKDISEKCISIDGFGRAGFFFLVRFPTKLRHD